MPVDRHPRQIGRRGATRLATTSEARFELLECRTLYSGTPVVDAAVERAPAVQHVLHAAPTLGGTGLTAEYFSDTGLTTPLMIRTDASISFKGSTGTSAALKAAGGARWTGSIAATASSTYTFSVQGTGGVTLSVNGVVLINTSAITGGAVRASAPISMVAGQKYAFALDYHKAPGSAPNVKLLSAANNAKQAVVPQTDLFPSAAPPELAATSSGLIGQYFIGTNFTDLAFTRVDPTINFNFGSNSPDASIPKHSPFSILWTGQIHPSASANYTFTTTSDDGVRLYVGTQLVIDNFVQQSSHTASGQVALTAGQAYDIKVEYFQNGVGVGDVKLQYSTPTTKLSLLPASMVTSTPPASAGLLTAVAAAADQVDLSWTGSSAATGYTVSRSTDDGVTWVTDGTAPAGATTFADHGLTADTAYAFRVTPYGSAATSTASNVATATTLTDGPATVTATAASPGEVDLSWADVPGETGFDVLESVAGGPYLPLASTAAGVTDYAATGLLPGTAYGFEVEALNAAGAPSAPTATAAATATPTAAPGALVAVGTSTTTAQLTWTDVAGEGGFEVERSTDGAAWAVVGTTPAGVTTYADTGLAAGTSYSYRVLGLSAADPTVASLPSAVATAPTVTAAPASVGAAAFSTTTVDLTWADVTGEAGFDVLESVDGGATYLPVGQTAAGVTTFAATPLLPGTAYQFEVEAVNAAGQASAPSAAAGTSTLTLAPAALTALGTGTTSALLTWTPVLAATGYVVQRSTDGTTWTSIATPAASAITYADHTLSAGTSYSYRVAATDVGGASAPSPVAVALTVPGVVTAALSGLNVATSSVSFPAVSGATSYAVQRSTDGSTGWTTVATVAAPASPSAEVASPATSAATLSATVPNLAPSTVYYYRVIASNPTGASAPSAVVSQMSAPLATYAANNQLYGATASVGSAGTVYALNMTAGTSTLIGQLLPGAYAATRRPTDGDVYYFVGNTTTPAVYKWDPTTGNNTLVVDTNVYAAVPNRRAYDLAGNAWQTDTAGNLYSVNSSHVTTLVAQMKLAGVSLAAGAGNMAFSPSGTLYLANNGTIYTVNTTTAAVTLVTALGVNDVNIAFGADGLIYCTDSQGQEYSVNPTALTSTLLQNPAVPAFNSVTSTPEFVDLGVTATATPTVFQPGHSAAYAVNVTNAGPSTTDTGSITVSVTLGTGLTYASVAGTGWSATTSGTTVTLAYSGSLIANGSAPVATLNVNVSSSATLAAVTTFTVSGDQFETSILNDTAVVTSTVS